MKRRGPILVNGRKYKIKRVTQKTMATLTDSEHEVYGLCDSDSTTIHIDKNLSDEADTGALEHEVGHASCEESGARSIISKFTDKGSELEELLIRVWFPVWSAALKARK